jgi:hypothetical protein
MRIKKNMHPDREKIIPRVDVFIHLHIDSFPRMDAPASGDSIISFDIIGDQSPLSELRGNNHEEPAIKGLIWSHSPDRIANIGFKARRSIIWDGAFSRSRKGAFTGLKQISLVRRKKNLSPEEFAGHYRNHRETARCHHGMSQYAQSLSLEPIYGFENELSDIDGVSELWFTTERDWKERFYVHPESQNIVRKDTQKFIDFTRTRSFMVDEILFTEGMER